MLKAGLEGGLLGKLSSKLLKYCMGLISVGVITSTWAATMRQQSAPTQGSNAQSLKKERMRRFSNVETGEVITEEGVRLAITTYKVSDGGFVTVTFGDLPDSQQAKNLFDKTLVRSAKIIDRRAKMNGSGKVVGERALIYFPGSGPKDKTPAVLWTNGVEFCEIVGTSLRDVSAMEKAFKN
jgi:hypothetical protein